MPVPESVRKVPRPKNTIVEDSGRDSDLRYSVRERAGSKYVSGHNPSPRNGKVIGHIINSEYVPIDKKPKEPEPDRLSYGAVAFVHSVSSDLYSDLLTIFTPDDACTMMAIAAMRVTRSGISASRMASAYRRTFARKFWPGANLSPNSITKLFERIGESGSDRKAFFVKRAAAVEKDHHVAIDGTLKQDGSKVNDLSAFSRKSRVRGCKEISVLYAYDIEKMEPVCAEVFPGNIPDSGAYASFIRINDIRHGIIISDKGFPPSIIAEELKNRPELHFITPLKRNDTRIKNNNMLSFQGKLTNVDGSIMYCKRPIKGGHYLYAFESPDMASDELKKFISADKQDGSFNKLYEKKKEKFGVIVFESDLDLEPRTVYTAYNDRWLIELVFDRHKNDLGLDRTRVQGDFSVIGSEFVNFIATIMTCRMLKKATDAKLLEDRTWGNLLEDLSEVWRDTDALDNPKTDDEHWHYVTQYEFEEMEALGLSEPIPKPEPKKRGRPAKKKEEPTGPKRPRGRPRKNPLPEKKDC